MNGALRDWIEARPPNVRAVARRYPPGSTLDVDGRTAYVLSYEEYKDGSVGLGVSYLDPRFDYNRAMALKFHICACCLTRVHGRC